MTLNFTVVGAGGTGTHLLRPLHMYLTAYHGADDWLLRIIDGDVVEQKNLARQQFNAGNVTANKAIAAAEALLDTAHVISHPVYLGEDNIEQLVQNGDTVLICADNMTVRKRIEERALQLDTITVINGGNEKFDGSVQLWVRENGRNITPPISYLHPEVRVATGADRAEMTCAQAAALPGGEQTLIANLQSATWMLTALWRRDIEAFRALSEPTSETWTELQFDALNATVEHIDQRISSHWDS